MNLPLWADPDRWSTHQLPVYNQIIESFDSGNNLVLLDAPTGQGKSLIAYMVRQYLETSGYYLVGTKTLQDQMERSFPDIAVIKGKANYTPNGIDIVTGTEHWSDPTCADCDVEGIGDNQQCSYCVNVSTCPYPVARDYAAMTELPCANMAYALGEWTSPRSRFRGRGLVILDECDTAPEEILGHVSVAISPQMKKRLNIKSPTELLGRVKTVESAWPQWFEYAVPHVMGAVKRMPFRTIQDKRRVQTVRRLLDRMVIVAADLDGWVYDPSMTKMGETIEFKPVLVSGIAKSALWSNGQRWLAMSASLGSPEQFVKDMGWEESYGYVVAESTFDPARRPVYFCPSATMTKNTEEVERPKMAIAVEATLDHFPDKNILVHSHTYPITRALTDHLETYDRPIFAYHHAGERADAIKAFESTPGSVLIASSLDRGYDNSNIDVVALCKIPFPYLGSKQVQKRWRETEDGKTWYSNITAQSITQMIGRAMRSETDSGIIVILDSVFSRFYSEWTYSGFERNERDEDIKVQLHRLLPRWILDALHMESALAFELRQRIKSLTREANLRTPV